MLEKAAVVKLPKFLKHLLRDKLQQTKGYLAVVSKSFILHSSHNHTPKKISLVEIRDCIYPLFGALVIALVFQDTPMKLRTMFITKKENQCENLVLDLIQVYNLRKLSTYDQWATKDQSF